MKIITATEGSTFSRAAVKKCCQMIVKPENAAIKIISAYQMVVTADMFVSSVQYSPELEEALRTQAEGFFERSAAAAIREYFPNTHLDLSARAIAGVPSQVIIETAGRVGGGFDYRGFARSRLSGRGIARLGDGRRVASSAVFGPRRASNKKF